MCIRDSAWAELAFLAVWAVAAGWLFFRPHEYVLGAADAGAVSYTHLRAHETVLDLVCRLLLETKNDTHCYIK